MKRPFKLQADHIRVGQPLPWNVFDESEQLLLSRGYVIDSDTQLASLTKRGMYVEASDIESQSRTLTPTQTINTLDPFWIWDDLTTKSNLLLSNPVKEPDFESKIADLSQRIRALTHRESDATIAIIMMPTDNRRYSVVHGLQVASLADLVASRLQWDEAKRHALVCSALTMNIGMLTLQQQLTNQRMALSPDQARLVREHPLRSVEILRQAGVSSEAWLDAVERHHETPSGNGYPKGIKEESDLATMLRTMDVFAAKISPRAHRKPMTGTQAARSLYAEKDMAMTNNPYIPTLIREIGIYPPGTFVKLSNGEIGIVQKRSENIKSPSVLSLINSKGDPLNEPIARDTSRDIYAVKSDVARDSILIPIKPSNYWGGNATRSERKQWG